ncbi:uncharacterized protein LOC112043656 [Bicyclus anynana]|uniref:Uncharacterized protein LOC112043656 n=1 Tax=Bicyclus anynana TaxID=110368 RepID=A0ABM3LKL3_BICAN|nr:uncharacterized protein LOC112043656 [Bicyclus anynana]
MIYGRRQRAAGGGRQTADGIRIDLSLCKIFLVVNSCAPLPDLCREQATLGRRAGGSLCEMARRPILYTSLLFFVVGCGRAAGACVNASAQLELMLAEYERAEPPPAARVRAALDVQHAAVDDRAASVRLLAALHLNWEDKRLSWNASAWGCRYSMTASEKLWLPDVSALNAVTGGAAGGVGLRARLASEGRVSWVLRFDLTAPLSLALEAWPRDVQRAVFKFGSRHHAAPYNLTIEDLTHATVFESGTWELLQVTSEESAWRGGDVAQWTVTLRRRAAAHALAAGGALAAAVLLLLGAALLPPAERPALCALAAFTAALWLTAALARVPAAAEAPRCMRLLNTACVCAALLGAGAALVRRVAECSSPPPAALYKLAPPERAAGWSAWAAAAQLLDRALLAAVSAVLLVVLCMFLSAL